MKIHSPNKQATPEKMVADTILARVSEIALGGNIYTLAPPTLATLIMVSEVVSSFPQAKLTDDKKKMQYALSEAKNYGVLPELLAILILGAKAVERAKRSRKWRWFGKSRYDRLVEEIRLNASPGEVKRAIIPMFNNLEIRDFFVCTTFLAGINILKPTMTEQEAREVEQRMKTTGTEATASGQ